ncbi:MAG: hypothetical protein H6737_02705 [Alphaproteobacteria bacterium]|nr:hypothetical protein [Alphaproteobacteria bacterium]
MRSRLAGAALVVLLLVAALFWVLAGGSGGVAVERAPVPNPPHAPEAPDAPEDLCATRLERMRERLGERAEVRLEPLIQELELASGQSRRAAGLPLGPVEEGPFDAPSVEARAAEAASANGFELVGVDCEEYPCIARFAGPPPDARPPAHVFSGVFHAAAPSGGRTVFTRTLVRDGRLHGLVAWSDAARPEPVDEVGARARFRAARAVALEEGADVPAMVQPRVSLAPVSPDPCGPEHERLRALLEGRDAALREAIDWHWAVVQLTEPPLPFPDDLPDRFREPAAWAVGRALSDLLDVGLVEVDCSEPPCIALLSAKLPPLPDSVDVDRRILEAVGRLEGYGPDEVTFDYTLVHQAPEPDLFVRVYLYAPNAGVDVDRLQRRTNLDVEVPPEPSALDWSQPLP